MAELETEVPEFLEKEITFDNGHIYQLQRPLTNFRSCHDGYPQEARMVFTCTRKETPPSEEEFIMKIKVQLPKENQTPQAGPSTTTAHELQALQTFATANTPFAPHFIAYHSAAQPPSAPLPTGFITYTVMTKLPGHALFTRYWNTTTTSQAQRDEILPHAVKALRAINALGIEPVDRGLRNVMWDAETKRCGIIDFELWEAIQGTFADEKSELQRWGLLRTPPAKDHFAAFQAMYR